MKEKIQNQKGLTLIEVIVGILLIGLIFLGFYGLFISSKKISVSSEEIVDATYVAQQTMEELYSLSHRLSYGQIQDHYIYNYNALVTNSNPTTNEITIQFDHYLENTSIKIKLVKLTNPSISPNANLYNILIQVFEHHKIQNSIENIITLNS